jgi:hypothetical protein
MCFAMTILFAAARYEDGLAAMLGINRVIEERGCSLAFSSDAGSLNSSRIKMWRSSMFACIVARIGPILRTYTS